MKRTTKRKPSAYRPIVPVRKLKYPHRLLALKERLKKEDIYADPAK